MTTSSGDSNPHEWNLRVFRIAESCASLAGAEQESFLTEACAGDERLLEGVRRLIAAADACDQRSMARTQGASDWGSNKTGDRVDRYRLLQRIGEGGFGEVWMAEQVEPVKRRVAIKLIKPGMDSGQVIARFEAERQALALMDHPNISRVLDAGTTVEGRLYFVMELVKGMPITEYCKQANLDIRERVSLMRDVCRAVQHAHQKGVIHRDLKPANVLVGEVDGRPVPKVIDFGVAKALERPLTDRTLFTEFRQFLGTPEYMSPEQADLSMIDVDTRSDVYALGVLLYELLTGTTPFDAGMLRSAGFDEMRRIIREDEPLSPSVRVHRSRSHHKPRDSDAIENSIRQSRLIRGELDWIVQRAMAKERDRRYATANDMADDLGRFLAGQPVEAGPPSVTYRVSRFLRRHRAAAVVLSLLALSLVGFVGLVIWDNARVHEAELVAIARAEEAERERAVTVAINTFLNDDLLAAAAPSSINSGRGHEVTMREVLDAASDSIEGSFPDDPRIEASIRSTLGRTYLALGLLDSSEVHLRRALALNSDFNGPEHPMTLGAMDELTMLLLRQDEFGEAESNLRTLIATRSRLYGVDAMVTIKTIEGLGVLVKRQGRLGEAEEYYNRALQAKQRVSGFEHEDTLLTMDNIAKLHMAQGRYQDADELLVEIIEIRDRQWGADHPQTLDSRRTHAGCLRELGRLDESRQLCDSIMESQFEVYGPTHFRSYQLMATKALSLSELGHHEDAAELMRRAVAGMSDLRDPDHSAVRVAQIRLAQIEANLGDADAARAAATEALESLERTQGPMHPTTLVMRRVCADIIRLQGHPVEAEDLLRENIPIQQKILGPDHPETIRSINALVGLEEGDT